MSVRSAVPSERCRRSPGFYTGSKQGKQLTVEIIGSYQWRPDPPPTPLTPDYQHYRTVRLTGLDPNVIFNQAGGMAVGENSRWTLFRCASQVSP